MNSTPKFLTERDNKTPCPVRIGYFVVFVQLLIISTWSAYKNYGYDFTAIVHGWIFFLGAAAASITGKALTEPKPTQEEPQQ